MWLLYALIALGLPLALHIMLLRYASAPPAKIRLLLRILAVIAILAFAVLMLRFGQPLLGGLTALLGVMLASANRLFALATLAQLFRRHRAQAPQSRTSTMGESEAREILGVSPTATRAEIKSAYQQKMKQYHPDQGGSEYFAKKLNEAKTTLLNK